MRALFVLLGCLGSAPDAGRVLLDAARFESAWGQPKEMTFYWREPARLKVAQHADGGMDVCVATDVRVFILPSCGGSR